MAVLGVGNISDKERYGIIYKATNKVKGKVYIEQTTQGLAVRRAQHEKVAFRGTEEEKRTLFSRGLRKYGVDKFTWEVLSIVANYEELNYMEVYWIAKCSSFTKSIGYNMTSGGPGTPRLRASEHTKSLIRRSVKGFNNPCSILTKEQVIEIKIALIAGETGRSLAQRYKVGSTTISRIKSGKSFSDVFVEGFNKVSVKKVTKTSLEDSEIINILKLLLTEEFSYGLLGDMFNVPPYTVEGIKSRKTYAGVTIPKYMEDQLTHLNNKPYKPNTRRAGKSRQLFTEDEAYEILSFREANKETSLAEIAEKYQTNYHVISGIVYGKTYKKVNEKFRLRSEITQ